MNRKSIRNRIHKKFPNYEYQNQSTQIEAGYVKHLVLHKILGHYVYSSKNNDNNHWGELFPGPIEKIARVVVRNYNNKVELVCPGSVSVNLSKDGYIPFVHRMEYKKEDIGGFEILSYISNMHLRIKGNFKKNKKYTIERYVYGYCIEKNNEITSIINL